LGIEVPHVGIIVVTASPRFVHRSTLVPRADALRRIASRCYAASSSSIFFHLLTLLLDFLSNGLDSSHLELSINLFQQRQHEEKERKVAE
jgi:hypothetical protein